MDVQKVCGIRIKILWYKEEASSCEALGSLKFKVAYSCFDILWILIFLLFVLGNAICQGLVGSQIPALLLYLQIWVIYYL